MIFTALFISYFFPPRLAWPLMALFVYAYATPLFYPIEILPEWMLNLEIFNPMYHYVTYFREIVLWGTCPGLMENLLCILFAVVTLVIGLIVFKVAERKFILYV